MKPGRRRPGLAASAGRIAIVVALPAVAFALVRGTTRALPTAAEEATMLAAAIANLEAQSAKLTAEPGPSCPDDFPALAAGRPLRISLFYGYDEHDGRVWDRADAHAMAHVLSSPCRGQRAACGFALASDADAAIRLTRTLRGDAVEVNLFTSSLAAEAAERLNPVSAYLAQNRLSRAAKERYYRELVASDVVFYMGHSRLGGGMGFDRQTGFTTAVNALSRLPLVPIREALRRRPTHLKLVGLFSCDSNRYFRTFFTEANPSLSLILTNGDVDYGPAEQASLGALEGVLSRSCGYAFQQAMISVEDGDPHVTALRRGR